MTTATDPRAGQPVLHMLHMLHMGPQPGDARLTAIPIRDAVRR
jgi:hypothetical protein